jgi:macrolide transport system ATP-binding/permease protein
MIIKAHNICKSYGAKTVLNNVSLIINEHDHIGLVGENGCGKTTLCRILFEKEQPDSGRIEKADGLKIGYLPQEIDTLSEEMSVQQYFEHAAHSLDLIKQQIELLAQNLNEENMARYAELQDLWEQRGGYELDYRISMVKQGLGIDTIDQNRYMASLSGGEKTRIALAALLIYAPDILILDEPTNHLDFATLKWLEDYLRNFKGAFLIISHDREFLNKTVNKIIEISFYTHESIIFHGNCDYYLQEKERLFEKDLKTYEEYIAEVKELKSLLKHKTYSTKGPRPPTDNNKMAWDAWREAAEGNKSSKIQALKVRLDKLEENPPHRPLQSSLRGFYFYDTVMPSQKPFKIEHLFKSYDSKIVLNDVNREILKNDHIIIVGENGSGKTTFLKLLAGQMKPDDGHINIASSVSIGYLDQEQKSLNPDNTVLEEYALIKVAEEGELRGDLHKLGLFTSEEVFLKVKDLSLGQKQKLMLAKIVAQKPNVLILDEPTNHLDLIAIEELEKALKKFSGVIVAVSHDRRFIEKIATSIWTIVGSTIL